MAQMIAKLKPQKPIPRSVAWYVTLTQLWRHVSVDLAFEYFHEIQWCDHSNKTSSAVPQKKKEKDLSLRSPKMNSLHI